MREQGIAMIPSLGNYLENLKQFVDDTFMFALPDKIGYKVNQLNLLNGNIQFTIEMKEGNKLAFLDEMVFRNIKDTINTKV